MTKKYARFRWTEDCQYAFEALKDQLTVVSLLAYANLSKLIILYTDASNRCIGAVLMQPCPDKDGLVLGVPEEVPIYFLSHRLSETQQRWPVIEKEVLAILYSVQKLDYYLSGAVFTIKTDHQPLKYLLEAEWMNKKIQQWVLKLGGYNYKMSV